MKIRDLSVLASFLMACASAVPAVAGVTPYVRVDYGQNELRMTDQNNRIRKDQAAFVADDYPAAFETIGYGYGPGVSAGVWILPGLRVGATYSYLRAVRNNRLDVDGEFSYADGLDLRKNEVGVEAAVRFKRLAGLTAGANVAMAWAEMTESVSLEDVDGTTRLDVEAHRTKPSFGVFVGIDQTNEAGVAGFIRAGFQYCDMGQMPCDLTLSDGTSTVQTTGKTIWTDYSGFYVKVGVGYDLVR